MTDNCYIRYKHWGEKATILDKEVGVMFGETNYLVGGRLG